MKKIMTETYSQFPDTDHSSYKAPIHASDLIWGQQVTCILIKRNYKENVLWRTYEPTHHMMYSLTLQQNAVPCQRNIGVT
jgi:hypothetical protein